MCLLCISSQEVKDSLSTKAGQGLLHHQFFEEEAKVKVCAGVIYGDPTCVRFNYGCPRAQLVEALDRMEAAIKKLRESK